MLVISATRMAVSDLRSLLRVWIDYVQYLTMSRCPRESVSFMVNRNVVQNAIFVSYYHFRTFWQNFAESSIDHKGAWSLEDRKDVTTALSEEVGRRTQELL